MNEHEGNLRLKDHSSFLIKRGRLHYSASVSIRVDCWYQVRLRDLGRRYWLVFAWIFTGRFGDKNDDDF